MTQALRHRGPDDDFVVSADDFALGARRLSIVDVAGGRQPVTNETETDQVLRALNAGANEYVMKPFTKEVLLAKLSLLDVYEE